MDDAMFRYRLQNALVQSTYDLNLPIIEIRSKKEIAPDLWHVTFIMANGIMLRVLAYDHGETQSFDLFFTLPSVRVLLLDPMTEDVKNAIKDYHSIGHQ